RPRHHRDAGERSRHGAAAAARAAAEPRHLACRPCRRPPRSRGRPRARRARRALRARGGGARWMKRRDGRGDGLATAVAASATIFILAGGVRPGGRPVALVVASAMQALAVAAACCAFAVGRAGKPRSRRALVAVIVLAPIVLLAGKLLLGAA